MTDQEELEVFGKKYYDDANRINNDVRFSVFSNQEQVEFYKKRAQRNRSGIQNVIAYALADGDDFIIEGFHLRPEVIAEKLKER
jgi:2-phosphoglycerate kinase